MKLKWWYAIVSAVVVGAFFRFVSLNSLPASVYWDEVSLGYDAYAISLNGRDLHNNAWPFPAFFSYGDYKPAGYFYFLVPFIKILGLHPWVIRTPSALAGSSLVLATALLSYLLVKKNKLDDAKHQSAKIAAIAAAWFTALSPWAIQFSRGGWEVNVATTLVCWGVVLWLWRGSEKKWLAEFLAIGLWALAAYTYHAARVVAPAILVLLLIQEFPVKLQKKWADWGMKSVIMLVGLVLLLLPLIIQLKQPVVQKRFAETSLLADGSAVTLSNSMKDLAGNSWWSKLVYHRWVTSAWLISQNAALHLSPQFLFLSGDQNLRHGTGYTGILFVSDALWLVLGFCALRYLGGRRSLLLLGWFAVGILPPAVTTAAPHALRFLLTLPVFMVLLSLGVVWARQQLRPVWRRWLLMVVIGAFVFNFSLYWLYYTKVYAVTSAQSWQYGYAEVVPVVQQYRQQHPELAISFTREQGRPAMYYWFYGQVDPRQVQAQSKAPQDQGEFLEFDNIFFVNTVNEAKAGLVVSSVKGYEQLRNQNKEVKLLQTINDARGQPLWQVYELR